MDAADRKKLEHAFQVTFSLPEGTNYQSLEFAKSSGWDSIAHMQLIAAIEKHFNLMLDTDEVLGLSSFNKAMEIVDNHGKQNSY